MLHAGKVPAEREENVLALIAALGSPQDLRMIFDLVLNDKTPMTRKTVLLEGLSQAMRQRQAKPSGELKTLDQLLEGKDDGVRAAAARLGGVWKLEALRASLERYATAPEAPLTVRQAVAEALVALGGPKSATILVEMTASTFPFQVRSLGVIQLAELDV